MADEPRELRPATHRLFGEPPPCERCGERDTHVCIPEVLDMLKQDAGFRDLVREVMKELG